jgi:hypothetical protein
MWTPRRLLLLFVAAGLAAGAFYGYSVSTLGRIDGLPQLPAEYAVPATDATLPPPSQEVSPTTQQLIRAFGERAAEVTDPLAYKFKFEDREKGLVFAAGQPQFAERSKFVVVSPFSVGFFAAPKPKAQMAPGEVQEITTFHADRCRLEFDREVASPQDILGSGQQKGGGAKMVGMELLSDPDLPTIDRLRGRIWVTNNQRSADPNERLLFRTPGPLFYQNPDAGKAAPDAPQVWTAAGVEVIDCRNLPRPLPPDTDALPVVPGDALRVRGVVADMATGGSLPPPTMTATGMKVYLKQKAAGDADRRNTSGYSGVRLVELLEGVQVNLWSDGNAGLPGTGPPGAAKPANPSPLAGGAADGAEFLRKLAAKSLLVIETTGAFRYDFAGAVAKFDVATTADPNRPNAVTVTRLGAGDRSDVLACEHLEVRFFGGNDKGGRPEGMSVKGLTATGPHVYISVEAEGFTAQGTRLDYRTDPAARTTVTALLGSPVVAKKDRNKLEGGSADRPTELVLTTIDPPPPPPGQPAGPKKSLVEVRGPGRMSLFDAATNDTTLSATWKTSLAQQKDAVGTVEQDLLKFEGDAKFEDRNRKSEFELTADSLWLWLAAAERKPGGPANPLPQRLLARQNVRSKSADLEIGMAGQPPVDLLTVWFRDGAAPPPPAKAVQPLIPAPTPATASPPPAVAAAPASPAAGPPPPPPKQPVVVSARAVESWVMRYPEGKSKPGEPAAVKYELERTRCDDRVVVHQEPADPTKAPRGLDIVGQTLNLVQTRAGSVMTVTGTPLRRAEVHFETTSITGPTVKIDQVNNGVEVAGGGTLRMPSREDAGGLTAADRASELEVTWAREMRFEGANARAEFVGAVKAVQTPDRGSFRPKVAVPPPPGRLPPPPPSSEPTWTRTAVFCHQLDVGFDRPIYFTQARRTDGPKRESAKLSRAVCTPRPDDEASTDYQDRIVIYLEETLDRRTRKLTKAQRVECKELELQNDDPRREQRVFARGEGEVRILQAGAKDGAIQPGRPAADGEEMKLTFVRFATRMTGVDKGKLFQSATFDDGARVWQVPTDDLNLAVDPANTPAGTVSISSEEKLEVTSERPQPGAAADQRLVATGSAEAFSDDYRGAAPVIRFIRDTVVFDGTDAVPASFSQLRTGPNQPGNQTRGKRLIYHRTERRLDVSGGTTGSFAPGGR